MNYPTLIIIGIAGIVLGVYLGRLASAKATAKQGRRIEEEGMPLDQTQNKEENKRKILEFFESPSFVKASDGQARVANNDIEALLGVSDVHPAN